VKGFLEDGENVANGELGLRVDEAGKGKREKRDVNGIEKIAYVGSPLQDLNSLCDSGIKDESHSDLGLLCLLRRLSR